MENRNYYDSISTNVIYTGEIDKYFNYQFGKLEYRSLKFENEVLNIDNYQGVAIVNYTSANIPYTRIIEHKHFEFGTQPSTIITKEYPVSYDGNNTPYYPIRDVKNEELYNKYKNLSLTKKNVIFGGRLGVFRYYDMHQIIGSALSLTTKIPPK